MIFNIYIYILYRTDYIALQKVRKICEHVLSGHIRLLDEQKIPVLDTRSRFTGKVDKLDRSFGVWRQGHSEGALTAKNALLTPQVGSMVGPTQLVKVNPRSPSPNYKITNAIYPSTPAQKGQGACLSTARIPPVPEL